MSQSSGPFIAPSHGYPSFNSRLPSLSMTPSLKRSGNGPMSLSNLSNPSFGPNMNVPSSTATLRSSTSMGPSKPTTAAINPMDKSNSMSYSSRYTRKTWSTSRSMHDKNIRGHDDHELLYGRSGTTSHNIPPESTIASSFTIEPAVDDDENEDIYFSSRHMAGGRFQRNQRLIAEIFNEICIPDLRTNISVERILTLRREVNALKTHRDTFEKDLNDLEEKHAEKKRKFMEANEKFHSEYTEASVTNLSQEKINEILQKHVTMEKLQKEKQLFHQQQQQQQATVIAAQPSSISSSSAATTTVVTTPSVTITPAITNVTTSEINTSTVVKTDPELNAEVSQEETVVTPPPPVQTEILPPESIPVTLVHAQSATGSLPPSQHAPAQLPSAQSISLQLPSTHPVPSQIPHSQPPIQPQVSQPSPVMPQMPLQQHQLPVSAAAAAQGYPVMYSGGAYTSSSNYVHPQHAQYRSMVNQRPVQYPSNVQWQQQQAQQWQTSTYDPRYYNPYPSNVQWSQQAQPQQWSSNPSQQQMGVVSHQQQVPMRGPPLQQQTPMYGNSVSYGYGGTTGGWNTSVHPSQSYVYSQNPSYDLSMVSAPPQQQYYSQPQMHSISQGYEYTPPPQQQQQQQQQSAVQPPPQSQMN